MNQNNIIIEQIKQTDMDKVAVLLSDAFYTNPAYAAVFKKRSRLREGLIWLFKASLLMNNQKQTLTRVLKDKSSGEIIGTYTIIPPEGVKSDISIYSKLRLGWFVSNFGLETFFRMVCLDTKNKKILANSMGDSKYYYLSMVVIKEEYRGKGVGSYVLKHFINKLVNIHSGYNIIGLTTQLPENVTFYSRLGFTVLDEEEVIFRETKYYIII